MVKTVEDPINIAYSSLDLPLHMDLSYYQSSPGLQLLHCVRYCAKMTLYSNTMQKFRFDECIEGGESILLDAYPVVEEMRKTHPKQFEILTRVPATFQKVHYERLLCCNKLCCPYLTLSSVTQGKSSGYAVPETTHSCELLQSRESLFTAALTRCCIFR